MEQEIVIKTTTGDGEEYYIVIMFSGNPAMTDGCDASIGYTVYDMAMSEVDGGEMDYDSEEKAYGSIEDAVDDIIDFISDDFEVTKYVTTGLTPEDFE